MFRGYYEQYRYLPIAVTCAENDMVVLIGLRHGTCPTYSGARQRPANLVERLRAVWPDVHIHMRADSGFGVPLMYNVCEELRLSYTLGIGMNSRLRDLSDDLLKQAGRTLTAPKSRNGALVVAIKPAVGLQPSRS